ncbi:MAG: PEP-CTERM sorting domain-containing protein [Phycisphaerales bacterium]|nr:PEP-CTERM sorting domain-containing protein [Phycisphaerales bacterium]
MISSKVVLPALMAGFLATSSATATIVVSFDPPTQTVGTGDVFTVDIVASIPENDATIGWGLDFDIADLLLVTQTATPPVIGPSWDAAGTLDGDGLAGLAPTPPGTGIWDANNPILLATIELQADLINEGVTALLLSDNNPADLTEGFALEPPPAGVFANVTYEPGEVTVIPEPTTLTLLALVTVSIAGRRRR